MNRERPKLKDYRTISGRLTDSAKDRFLKDLQDWSFYAEEKISQLSNQEGEEEKWISVEDRLPEEPGFNITRVEEVNDLGISKYTWIFWFDESRFILDKPVKITHWMPLPTPPID